MAILGRNFETTELGGGKFQTELNLKPITYFEGGAYRRMALDFVDSGDPARPHIVTASPLMVSVAPDGMRRLHPTRELDRYLELGAPYIKVGGVWQKPNLGTPTRQGNLLQWTAANANLYVTAGGHFVKLGILLKNGWIPEENQFAFPVGINGLTRQGGNILRAGVPVARLRAPVVYDYDNEEDVRPVDWQFVNIQGQVYALFTLPDLTGMGRPLIDPTLELQPNETDGLDIYIVDTSPDLNTDLQGTLYIGKGWTGDIWRTLIKFDLSGLPADAVISSTTLSLYASGDYSTLARTYRVFRTKRAWVEAQATWNAYSTGNAWQTAGGFGVNDCEQTDIGSRDYTASETLNEFKDFNLTPTSKAALDLGNGWLIKADTENSDGYEHYSSSHATAANRPKLVVNYTAGTQYPQSAAGTQTWAGVLLAQGQKTLVGVQSFAGVISVQVSTAKSGALSWAGVLVNQANKIIAGSQSFVGVLVRDINKSLSGGITPAGVLAAAKQALKSIAGILSFGGVTATEYTPAPGEEPGGGMAQHISNPAGKRRKRSRVYYYWIDEKGNTHIL